jgi:hypothetical protein
MVQFSSSHGQDVYSDSMKALEGFYVGTMGLITVPMGQNIKGHGQSMVLSVPVLHLSHGHVSTFTPWAAVHYPWSWQTFPWEKQGAMGQLYLADVCPMGHC